MPAVVICTDIFTETSRAMARMWGADDFPCIFTAHPIAPLTRQELRARAEAMLDQIVQILTGVEVPVSAQEESCDVFPG